MKSGDVSKATLNRAPGPTGRDGAMDFAARGEPASDQGDDRFCQALGAAVIGLWSDLPQPIQETIFEHAVRAGHQGERDEALREELAKFLHDHHKRTAG